MPSCLRSTAVPAHHRYCRGKWVAAQILSSQTISSGRKYQTKNDWNVKHETCWNKSCPSFLFFSNYSLTMFDTFPLGDIAHMTRCAKSAQHPIVTKATSPANSRRRARKSHLSPIQRCVVRNPLASSQSGTIDPSMQRQTRMRVKQCPNLRTKAPWMKIAWQLLLFYLCHCGGHLRVSNENGPGAWNMMQHDLCRMCGYISSCICWKLKVLFHTWLSKASMIKIVNSPS